MRHCTKSRSLFYALFCVGMATIPNGMVAFAQTVTKAQKVRNSAVEFAVSNKGAVWRVGPDGGLISLAASVNGSKFPYTYDFRLLKVSPNGRYICIGGQQFLGNSGTGKGFLEVFQLSHQGQLELIGTLASKTVGEYPYALAFCGQGRFLYVLAAHGTPKLGSSILSGYRIGRQGVMTQLPNSSRRFNTVPINNGGQMSQADIISDPKGHFVYMIQPQSRTVLQYHVASNGTIETMKANPPFLPQKPSYLVFPSEGPFLYAVSAQDNSLMQLKVKTNGMLQVTRIFRFDKAHHSISPTFAITPSGRFLYMRDSASPFTKQYAIQSDGSLKSLSPSMAAFAPESMTVDLTSHFLYLVQAGETNERLIRPYRISSSGTLSQVKGNPTAVFGDVSLMFAYSSRH